MPVIGSSDDDCVDVFAIEQLAKILELGNFFTHRGRPFTIRSVDVADSDRRDVGLREELPPIAGTLAAASNNPYSDLVVGAENA